MTSRGKVLLFDDSETVLEVTAALLQEQGFAVVTLSNPALFPMTINRERPDVVLMDVDMPVVRGNKLVELATRHRLHPCGLYLHSDRSVDDLAKLAAECGAHGYIRKTSDAQALAAEIDRAIAKLRLGAVVGA